MKTILIADDEEHLRTLVRTTLEDSNYRIIEARNGLEALRIARAESPDLLVVDWVMPGMTGIEVVKSLQGETGPPIPFILLTARGQDWEKGEGAALGAHAYLVKPFSPLELLEKVEEVLRDKLKEAGITAKVESRIKRLFSIHRKLIKQGINVDQVYAMFAMRVIPRSLQDCYAVLGIVHNAWRPVPGRIKDFIAMPRPNLYQSLHTSVITEDGTPFEIQIRTEEMHKMAEEGIAAHWKYKDGAVSPQDEQRLAWLRQVVEWQRDVSDPNEFLSTLKIDLYPEEVYVFTPKGKVVVLPREATPIDFAYTVHTEVGHNCVGAKVNGRMVPLRHKLHSGDIVEILTQPGHKPSRDWLSVVKSSRARNKIKHWLNIHQRERAIEIGKKLIEKEARKYRIALKDIKDEDLRRVPSDYGLGQIDYLMSAIGFGKYSARQVLGRLAPPGTHPVGEEEKAGLGSVMRRVFGGDQNAIHVVGQGDLLVYRAK